MEGINLNHILPSRPSDSADSKCQRHHKILAHLVETVEEVTRKTGRDWICWTVALGLLGIKKEVAYHQPREDINLMDIELAVKTQMCIEFSGALQGELLYPSLCQHGCVATGTIFMGWRSSCMDADIDSA